MNILVRVDSSIKIGTGHLMRCLTLANALQDQGHDVYFICRDLKGNINQSVVHQGHNLFLLPSPGKKFASQHDDTTHAKWLEVQWQQDYKETSRVIQKIIPQFEWLLVDNYALDYRWENLLRLYVNKIMVIDDIADRKHDCDIILDQNYYSNLNTRYDCFVPFTCRMLLGPKYAILRPEFLQERQNLPQRDFFIKRILVFFGGVDSSNETSKALKAIEILDKPDLNIDVVIGSSNPNKSKILKQCKSMPCVVCHDHVENIAEFMVKADLAIGAGGTTTWERCCLGLPSLVEILEENQIAIAEGIDEANAGRNCGIAQDVTPESLSEEILNLMTSTTLLSDCSKASFNLVDGEGALRVTQAIQTGNIHLRKAEQNDCELLWDWANDPKVRQASFYSRPILWKEHKQWFTTKIKEIGSYIFIAENESGIPIGQIRFEISKSIANISYSVQKKYRGLGFGETILRVGIIKLVELINQSISFQGHVKPENIVSQKIFKKVGFSKMNSEFYAVGFELEGSFAFEYLERY